MLLALAGCAGKSEPTAAQDYAELSYAQDQKRGQQVADCLAESTGFILEVDWQGGIGYSSEEVPQSQQELVDEEMDRCHAKYWPEAPEKHSDESVARLYALQVEARKCYMAEGYSLSEPPSEATFIDTYQSGDEFWNLVMELTLTYKLGGDGYSDLLKKCPDPLSFFWE